MSDKGAGALLIVTLSLVYSYFFQGGGWNQNARFDTIRALVETGSFEITPYASNTGDVSRVGERLYANKPPGLALAGAPVYLVLFLAERAAGADVASDRLVTANAHILTFGTSGLPAVLLAAVLFWHFRREGVSVRDAAALAAAFGLGSLALPYAGVMMSHNLVAVCLFSAWLLLSSTDPKPLSAVLAGGLLGVAIVVDYIAAPLVALYAGSLLWRSRDMRKVALLSAGPLVGVAALLLFNVLAFSSLFATSYGFQATQFVGAGLFLGVFGWPEWERLYWLSFHPFRGVFYCCPVLLIPVIGLLRAALERSLRALALFPALVVVYFLAFNLSFNAWTGGWGIGPRYLAPALPFLFAYAHHGWLRHRGLSIALTVLSACLMMTVTAVNVMMPANNFGPPPPFNPVAAAASELAAGRVSVSTQGILDRAPAAESGIIAPGASGVSRDAARSPSTQEDEWDSYNLGEVAGLKGAWSLMPLLVVLGSFTVLLLSSRGEAEPIVRAAGHGIARRHVLDARRLGVEPLGHDVQHDVTIGEDVYQ